MAKHEDTLEITDTPTMGLEKKDGSLKKIISEADKPTLQGMRHGGSRNMPFGFSMGRVGQLRGDNQNTRRQAFEALISQMQLFNQFYWLGRGSDNLIVRGRT